MANDKEQSGWKGIIAEIKDPLKLLALIALIFNGILIILAKQASPDDSKQLFVFSLVAFVILFIVLVVLLKGKLIPRLGKAESNQRPNKYDFFIAAPMAAFSNNEEYQKYRNDILKIIETIKATGKFKNHYYAGDNIQQIENFESPDVSVRKDLAAIQESKYFIMIYLKKFQKPSSVVYEAGIALAMGKKSLYFGIEDNFPFLMKQVSQAFPHIKIYPASNAAEIENIIKNNGKELFV